MEIGFLYKFQSGFRPGDSIDYCILFTKSIMLLKMVKKYELFIWILVRYLIEFGMLDC